jgi:hypothetical protein
VKKNHLSFVALIVMAAFVLSCGIKDSSKQPGEQPDTEVKKPDSVIAAAKPPSGFQHSFAAHVTEVVIRGAGHWIVQEKTDQVQKALLDFFLDKQIK